MLPYPECTGSMKVVEMQYFRVGTKLERMLNPYLEARVQESCFIIRKEVLWYGRVCAPHLCREKCTASRPFDSGTMKKGGDWRRAKQVTTLEVGGLTRAASIE